MKILLILSVLFALCHCNVFEQVLEDFELWEEFKANYSRSFSSDHEENYRMYHFLGTLARVRKQNELYEKGESTWKAGINQFADMVRFTNLCFSDDHEYKTMYLGFKTSNKSNVVGATFISPHGVELPPSKDWRELGAVTPIKDQGQCGSCWAFSANVFIALFLLSITTVFISLQTGSLEGQHFRKTGVLVPLSEQDLVDCSQKYDNDGCDGGFVDNAFLYVKENKGIDTEEAYPYEGQDGKCRFNASNIGATDTGFVDIEEGNEDKLKEAVATIGPVSVGIDAFTHSFLDYSEGVYYEPLCIKFLLNHAVLAVGYGTDEKTGMDYWIVKNSWGTTWGEKGYIRMARNKDNNCGIASQASYPLV
ncbi:procathepsin L-like [Cloeon dipterum]|uniref:procathepsin L-like n=1 Tax=Cloeon dipterum TaxID=197152 RepID=UPI00321F7336